MSTGLKVVNGAEVVAVPPDRPFVIGRATTADLVLADRRVSRRHLVIEPTATGWAAVDISANGTWLEGRRVRRVNVRGEARFHLGTADGPQITLVLDSVAAAHPAHPAEAAHPAAAAYGAEATPAVPVMPAAPPGPPPPPPPLPAPPVPYAGLPAGQGQDEHHQQQTMRPATTGQAAGPVLPPVGDPDAAGAAGSLEREHGRQNTHPLKPGRMSIGRSLGNDIVLGDLLASREHAELFVGRSGTEIVDLGSANGTFVNGQRVSRALLRPGDIIAIGHHIFHHGESVLVEYLDSGDVTFEVDGLNVFVGEVRLLQDVTFRLPGRALLAVIGPSGAGKSTLLNALTGFRPADAGTVRYAGRDMYAEYDELRRRIGYVPQDDILHTTLTVRQALGYGAELRFPKDTTSEERRARIDAVLAELGLTTAVGNPALAGFAEDEPGEPGQSDLADRQVAKLSGGQRKRTSVALELLTEPTLLYLDEPTSGLDPGLDKEVMESLRRLADGGRTVVVVTHSVAQLALCDFVLVLAKGGRIAYFGPPQHALPFFGQADWADAFRLLKTNRGADELSRRFHASGYFVQGSAIVPAARRTPTPLPSIRQQSVLSQLLTLSRRFLRVITSDKSYLRLIIAFPFVLGLIPRVIDAPYGLNPAPSGQPNREATLLLLVLILSATFMGASNSVREIVKEREIYRRERAIGLSRTAYLGSKIGVLTLITLLQSVVFTTIGIAGRGPRDGVVSDYPLLELSAVVAAVAITSAMMGLVISALVDNADKTMPLLVLLAMSQLVFTGALMPVQGQIGLEQISYASPARWGYGGVASVANLVEVQKLGNEQANPGSMRDPLWEHTATVFTTDLAGAVGIGIVSVIVTSLLLRRLDPRIVRRKR